VLAGGTHEPERRPFPAQRLLEEETNPAQGDRRRRACDLLLVGQVQEVPAQILLAELVGPAVMMCCQLPYRVHVAFLRACRQSPSCMSSIMRWWLSDLLSGADDGRSQWDTEPTKRDRCRARRTVLISPPKADLVQPSLAADAPQARA
jgi:hypothetical protein